MDPRRGRIPKGEWLSNLERFMAIVVRDHDHTSEAKVIQPLKVSGQICLTEPIAHNRVYSTEHCHDRPIATVPMTGAAPITTPTIKRTGGLTIETDGFAVIAAVD
jgi:hypothetical protein